ncbi:hypothetical protein BX600DRAFT_470063 [Xylariales sp. PMI_506]|nr:hypothetical protein BX600DRAFT_470063 [Xylariales sp. PMI_506]
MIQKSWRFSSISFIFVWTLSPIVLSRTVLRLDIAVDKYDMTRALRLYIQAWLSCDDTKSPDRLWRLTRASYLLHHGQAFETATLGLLCLYGEPYHRLSNMGVISFDIGDRFAAMMEERRARLRLEVVCRAAQIRFR